jgi:hypothetical protein
MPEKIRMPVSFLPVVGTDEEAAACGLPQRRLPRRRKGHDQGRMRGAGLMPAGYQLTTRPRPQTQDGSTDSELETPQPVDIEELMAKLDPWP